MSCLIMAPSTKEENNPHLPNSQDTMGRLSFSWLKAQYFHLAIISAFLSTWKEADIQSDTYV